MTASFLSQLGPSQNYQGSFILPPGLDLSAAVERGGAFLFAFTPDASPVASLNQFKRGGGEEHSVANAVGISQ